MARSPLRRSPGKGTLVDTWHYDAAHVTEEGGEAGRDVRKVPVELRLVKEFEGESDKPPMATKAVSFTLLCKDIGLELAGTDVEALRKAMWEKLDERYRIKWEGWLLVRVQHRAPYEGSGTGFTFSTSEVERGVAFDGSVLLREYQTFGARGFQVGPWPEQFKERGGRTVACIPATQENRDALEEFARRIDEMRRQLAEFVKPDAILRTLANISAHMALAGEAAARPRIGKSEAPGEGGGTDEVEGG